MSRSVAAALQGAARDLAAAGVGSPRVDAEVLLAHVLGTGRVALPHQGQLDDELAARFEALVVRRAAREPLQHLTGRAAFRHLELEVGPGVFVPRPETEVLAGVAIEALRAIARAGRTPYAVDLCSGSGAVAIALATEAPGVRVLAVEVEAAAAAYAVRNAAAAGVADRVEVRVADMAELEEAATDGDWLGGLADVVTANPPYIPLTAWESVAPEARDHDPPRALWSGDDGLDAVRAVARIAARLLRDGGLVACEHADVQGESAPAVFSETGEWRQVRDCADLTGRPRFVTARRARRRGSPAGTIEP